MFAVQRRRGHRVPDLPIDGRPRWALAGHDQRTPVPHAHSGGPGVINARHWVGCPGALAAKPHRCNGCEVPRSVRSETLYWLSRSCRGKRMFSCFVLARHKAMCRMRLAANVVEKWGELICAVLMR